MGQKLTKGISMSAWWTGNPAKLLRKTTLVAAAADHLPVYTLTFAFPEGQERVGKAYPLPELNIDKGEVVKMVIPGYKPKSYSMSEMRKEAGEFDITLKIYPNGRASGHLDRLKIGDTINCFAMNPNRKYQPGKLQGLVAYGVGITEALPVAQAELDKGAAEKVVLLWASKTEGDMFWADKIAEVQKKHGSKFELVTILSRQDKEGALKGRIDADVLSKVFVEKLGLNNDAAKAEARFLSVGTKEMMNQTAALFGKIGFPFPKHELLAG